MSYAFLFPDAATLKRKSTESTSAPSKDLLHRARTVLSHSETLARDVMSRVIGLNEAYEIAMAKT